MSLEVKVFGKPGCEYCKTTVKKFETFLGRWNINESKVKLSFFDMETTVDGMAEGAFYNVSKIPATIIENSGSVLRRWDGAVPLSEEFKDFFAEFSGPVEAKELN